MDIEGAWTRFVVAATEHGAGLKRRNDALRALPHPISLDERAGKGGIHDHEQKLLLLMERYTAIGVYSTAAVALFS